MHDFTSEEAIRRMAANYMASPLQFIYEIWLHKLVLEY